jgi:hypothetical protein
MITFKDKTDTELYRAAEKFAAAQERLAANTTEDILHWHHVALRDLIMELASRLVDRHPCPPSPR